MSQSPLIGQDSKPGFEEGPPETAIKAEGHVPRHIALYRPSSLVVERLDAGVARHVDLDLHGTDGREYRM
ncbi:hypothetical protein ACRE_068090 [Hapsidospora chrysogenum ATCC 11550]|uniref:Uncharacterized protein n=1 Tax=Hapsidospora chrysogenum (strain ATCC 11550 / CBS 779.69 / DSM 880 / IAM 14645 / JCM 23072 / IMI 49137) TaxID=857340 RepID=A0A086SZF2_HAPC1|nr:hypothetical protein ACRE_068090 [Hapsidospora chrysogenum ATCC 11550]